MHLFKRLPTRRMELLAVYVLVLVIAALLNWLHDKDANLTRTITLLALELLLPLMAGLAACGLLAGDPLLEIMLSAHRPIRQILAERLAFPALSGALLGMLLLRLTQGWGVELISNPSHQLFIWLPPLVFCLGLGSVAALWRGQVTDGVIAVIVLMGAGLISIPLLQSACQTVPSGQMCWWWLASPLMTCSVGTNTAWPLNRLFWLLLGLGLLALSFSMAQREETLSQAKDAALQ